MNPYMGDMASAVDRYTDIPAEVRARLQKRMDKRQYDEIVVIKRDSIEGQATYDPSLRDMHFGTARVCTVVSRDAWSASQEERGLVYCEGDQCLVVPTVCRNVSRITRKSRAVAGAQLLGPAGLTLDDELLFEPPGAGPLAQAAPMPEGGPIGNAPFTAVDSGAIGSSAVTPSLSSRTLASFANGVLGGGVNGAGAAEAASTLLSRTTASTPSFRANLRTEFADGNAPPMTRTLEQVPTGDLPAVLAVPEPGTWVLMLAGLIGSTLRCRTCRMRVQ